MEVTIKESGVVFGPFNSDQLFHIEDSKYYDQGDSGLKTVEFVYSSASKNNLLFVEAKTSAPNVNNKDSTQNIKDYILDLERKFYHSLATMFGLINGRHIDSYSEVPEHILKTDLKTVKINLFLVITSFETSWLDDWKNLLNQELSGFKKAWNINEIYVINTEVAKEFDIVR